jgi:N-acetylmuramoyl-L-alanine amidase
LQRTSTRRVWPLALVLATAALPASAERPVIRVSADSTGPSTRVVLTHTAPVSHEIVERDGGIEVVFADPVRLEPRSDRFDDPILARFGLEDDRRLVFRTGPGYRGYESFELSNPFRIVLDFQGTRSTAEATSPPPAARDPGRKIVVLDAGHGGIESGAIGPAGLREKDVTLDLARRLRRELTRGADIDVVLTRDEDRLVGLDERSAIANHNRADLFLSIHLNASARRNAAGAETYYLSTDATDDEARTLAALENGSAGVAPPDRRGAPPSAIDLVLWDLAQNQFLTESSQLAEGVQRQLNELTGTRDRGVRQAPFRVLQGATMPAILVEAGFISSPEEEARLGGAEHRDRIVRAIAAAIREYFDRVDRLASRGSSGAP